MLPQFIAMKGRVGSAAGGMNGLGHQFFSGSAFSLDQNRAAPRRNLRDEVEDLLHGRAFADDVLKAVSFAQRFFQAPVFDREIVLLHGILDGQQQFVILEWFWDKSKSPQLCGFYDPLDGCICRKNHGPGCSPSSSIPPAPEARPCPASSNPGA